MGLFSRLLRRAIRDAGRSMSRAKAPAQKPASHRVVVREKVVASSGPGGTQILRETQVTRFDLTPIVGSAFVIDGDTIIINKQRIRLYGIDAPEMDHPYGKKSKWALVAMCKGQQIRAVPDGSLSHDRCVARCYLPDGRDISAELVKQGLAIDWPKFSGGEYADLEPDGVRRKLWRAHNRQTGKYVPPVAPRT